MDACGLTVFVEQELDVPEADVVDEGGRRHIVKQPPIVDLYLKGADDEGLA